MNKFVFAIAMLMTTLLGGCADTAAITDDCKSSECVVDDDTDGVVDSSTIELTLNLALGDVEDGILEDCMFSVDGHGSVATGSTIEVQANSCVNVSVVGGGHYSSALDLAFDIREPQKEVCVGDEDVTMTLEADPVYNNVYMLCEIEHRWHEEEGEDGWEYFSSTQTARNTTAWYEEYDATCIYMNRDDGELCFTDLDHVVLEDPVYGTRSTDFSSVTRDQIVYEFTFSNSDYRYTCDVYN